MSEKQSFILQKLTLLKSPGLPRGLKSLEDLSPNINIVYGPNGSGKSSTVRAIQQLIWQQNKRGVELKASAAIDDDTWIFHIDHQPTLTQKNGIDAQLTDVPALEMHNHYALSINDLFIHDDAELAGEIRKQASGGYDLEEAKKALAYKSNIYTTAIKEYKEYEAARKAVNSIQNAQRQVKTRERSLETLRMEEREAKEARSKVDFLEKVVNYLKKSQEVKQLEAELDQYHEILELLRGDELDRIEELEKAIRDDQVQVNSIEQKIEEQENNLEQLDIPAEGIPRKVLDELGQRLNHLQSLEREANDLEVDIAELEESSTERLKAIDPGIDPALWKGINIQSTDELDQILPDAYQTLAKRHNIEARLQQLEEKIQDSDVPGVDLEQLNKALHALSEWLKVESVDRKYSTWSVVLLGLIIIFLGIIISGYADPLQYVPYILILTSVVIFASYFYLNINSKNNQLQIRKDDFESTGVSKPAEWTTEEVSSHILKIISEIQNEEKRLKNKEQKQELQTELAKSKKKLENLESRTDRFREVYQSIPEFPDFKEEKYTTFYWFIRNVEKWQNEQIKCSASKEKLEQIREQYTTELTRTNELLQGQCNAEEVEDGPSGNAIFRQLQDEVNARDQSLIQLKNEKEKLQQTQNQISKNTEKLNDIYEALGMKQQDKTKLRMHLNDLKKYQDKKKRCEEAKSALNERHILVKEHSLYESFRSDMESFHIDQLESDMVDLKIMAENYEGIRDEITTIETEINTKKRDDKLEKALNTLDEAQSALEIKYTENLNSIAGDILIRHLQSGERKRNQPQVVKRANVLLGKITRHRYELLSGYGANESFVVKDTETGIGQNLDELSSGTRVQLLLAIKIAYLELQERNLKLPLLADELLANSDDIRSPHIIQAFIELSKEGRQIFYFTAQRDEKRQWETHLDKEGMGYKSYTIGAGNEETYRFTVPEVQDIPLTAPEVPLPDGMNYDEYGKGIFTDFDLIEDEAERLPLYFLMNDASELHGFLIQGITRWIQLKNYLQYNGKSDGIRSEQLDEMKEKIEVLEKYQTLFRIGRSRRIDRSVLEDSGAISSTHMENVLALLKKLDGSPELLIEGLEAGEVPRFRTNKIEDLREYCIAQNLLDPSDKLTDDEIRIRLQALLSHMTLSGEEAEKFLRGIIGYQRMEG